MPGYPRQLKLDQDTLDALRSYLDHELTLHYAERGAWIDDLMRWQRDYWAKPSTERATFPFTGASTIVIPLTAIAVETIHARTMTTLFGVPQFVSAKPISDQWSDVAPAFERFLDHELLENIKVFEPLGDSILECIKFGTGLGKGGYEKIVKKAVVEVAGVESEFDVTIKQGSTVDAVALSRFIMPFYAKDPQTSPWVGEEHSKSPYALKLMAQSGMLRDDIIEKLEDWLAQSQIGPGGERKFDNQQAELENRTPVWPNLIDFAEIWLGFDVDGDGRDEEIVVHFHRPSGEFLSIRFNWNHDLRRPYRKSVYFPVEHRWNGLGVGKQNEQFMREITTQHRQRLDNATLANMRMIKVSKMSGYGPKEPVFPGKMWFLDDMTHLDTVQMGEIYPSAYNNEQATLTYSQQRTGVNEVTMGMPQVGTPGTATSDLARIQEGSKKFDFVYKNIKTFVNEIIKDTACNIQQFGPRDLQILNTLSGGQDVSKVFSLPPSYIGNGLIFSIHAAGQQDNKVVDRQNWMQIAQFVTQYYTNMLQLAMQAGDQQLVSIIMTKALSGGTETIKQILQSFDVRNIDRIIPSLLLSLGDGQQQPAATGGVIGPQQPNGPPGMGDISALMSQITGANVQ